MESQEEPLISEVTISLSEFLHDKVGIEDSELEQRIPVLDIGTKVGWTGYLDFVKAEDMSAPIMYGYDKHKRFFLTVRCHAPDGKTKVTTVFQRFINDLNSYAIGVRGVIPFLFPGTYMNDPSWGILRTLLTTGAVATNNGTFTLV